MNRFDVFNLLAPIYELLHGRRKTAGQVAGMLRVIEPQGDERVLDVGGGTGRVAQGFAGRVRDIVVLDPSRGMLAQTGKKHDVRPIRGCSEQLPFSDGCYNLVLCVDAFHHFSQRERGLDEIVRVLAPGGRVFFQDFDASRVSTRAMVLIEQLLGCRSKCYLTEDLKGAFQNRGLVVAREARAGSSYSFLFKMAGGGSGPGDLP